MSNKLKRKPKKFYHFDNSASGSAVSDDYELIRESADDEFSNKKVTHVKRAVNLFNDLDFDDYLIKANDELLDPEFLRDRHSFIKSDNNEHSIRSNENSTSSFNFTSNHHNNSNSNHFSSNISPSRKISLLDISEDFKKLQQDMNLFLAYDCDVYDKSEQEWMISNLLQKKLKLQQKLLKFVSEVDSKKDYQLCFKKLDDLADLETNLLQLSGHLQSKCFQNAHPQRLLNQPLLLNQNNKKSMIKNQFKQRAHDLRLFNYNTYEKNSVPRLELNNDESNANINNAMSSLNDSSTQGQINTLLLNTINQIFWSNSCQQKEIENLKNVVEKLRQTIERNGHQLHVDQQTGLRRNASMETKNEHEINSTDNHSEPTLSRFNLRNWNRSSQALNNKVPPGNRANNYWDNFRSYSRQNRFVTNSSPDHRSNPVRNNESPVFCNKLIDMNSVDVNLFHNIQNEDNSFHNRNKNNLKSSDEYRKNRQVANNETCLDALNSTNDISNDSDHLDIDLEQSLRSLYENNVASNSDIFSRKSPIDLSLRKNILQEVVFFINRNEDKPDYLMQLFQELKIISNNDSSRKNLIQALRILTHEQNTENQDNDHKDENEVNSTNDKHRKVNERNSENED